MPLEQTIRWIALSSMALLLSACVGDIPSRAEFMRMPNAIRTGAAETVIERVEESVDRAEVAAAIQGLVAGAETCYPWPGVWLDASDRIVGSHRSHEPSQPWISSTDAPRPITW